MREMICNLLIGTGYSPAWTSGSEPTCITSNWAWYTLLLCAVISAGCAEQPQGLTLRPPPVEQIVVNGSEVAWLLTGRGDLLSTQNGGVTWEEVSGKLVGGFGFERITFIDSYRGWASSNPGKIWSTTDSGRTWDRLTSLSYEDGPFQGKVLDIAFMDDRHGWVVTHFDVWRTEDGGMTWEPQPIPQPRPVPEGAVNCTFFDASTGWVYGQQGGAHWTQDGGRTWQTHGGPFSERDSSIIFVNDRIGWAASQRGSDLYQTDDGGQTWKVQIRVEPDIGITALQFADRTQGWACGFRRTKNGTSGEEESSVLLRTTDGGQSWRFVDVPEGDLIAEQIYFTDTLNGWLVSTHSEYAEVFRTRNSGESWDLALTVR